MSSPEEAASSEIKPAIEIKNVIASEDPYLYRPFTGKSQIRLIYFGESLERDSISTTLRTFDLESKPIFQAFSYEWGSNQLSKSISCGGRNLLVTENLYQALLVIDKSWPLWVDAICINQADVPERNAQVRLMSSIYGSASTVLAYLGAETGTDQLAFTALTSYYNFIQPGPMRGNLGDTALNEEYDIVQKFFDEDDLDWNKDSLVWGALRALIKRPYFQRMWIVQELTLASEAICVCGTGSISFDILDEVLHSIWYSGHSPKLVTDASADAGVAQVLNVGFLRSRARHGLPNQLTMLLAVNRQRLATDPRDMVFALLDLSADIHSSIFLPDYGLEVEEVYKRLTRFCLEGRKSYDILSLASQNDDAVENCQLPSWVPRLDRKAQDFLTRPFNVDYRDTFHAAATTAVNLSFADNFSRLLCKGILITTIAEIAVHGGPIQGFSDDYLKLVRSFWFKDCLPLAKRATNPYATAEDLVDVCWRTMTCGMDVNGHAASREYRRYYELFCKKDRQRQEHPERLCTDEPYPGWSQQDLEGDWIFESTLVGRGLGYDRGLCLTTDGYLGMIPRNVRVGDQICVLLGGDVPFVLRPDERRNTYRLVGEAYLHGFMQGEALGLGLQIQDITIR